MGVAKMTRPLFLVMAGRGNGYTLWLMSFRLDIKKKNCTRRVAQTWNRSRRELATSPSTAVIELRVVKATVDLTRCVRESCSRWEVGLQTS